MLDNGTKIRQLKLITLNVLRGFEWGLVFGVICPLFLVFVVKLASFLMFTVFGENTIKCLEDFCKRSIIF